MGYGIRGLVDGRGERCKIMTGYPDFLPPILNIEQKASYPLVELPILPYTIFLTLTLSIGTRILAWVIS